ncbi:NACHT domain- and WD repeat-containing protein 1-like [Ptychodera flava]|uniref:NACHT domain- and WD repeat-containing protein 1-like n=1 Tax=Ptychodera flava TaxID=63121 RepID=UPI00396A663C
MGCGSSKKPGDTPAEPTIPRIPYKKSEPKRNLDSVYEPENVTAKQRDLREDLRQILAGDTTRKCPSNAKIVRIFTSSTFTDTQHERNALMERVYPKLKKFCQEKGYEFQVVDMRWGVRDEATDDHTITELCLREVEACQNVSTGPFFVTFLSHKYGYRPLPRKISDFEMELLSLKLDKDSKSLVERWYKNDENEVPSMYILQPVSTNIPGYKSEEREIKKAAASEWWNTMSKLRKVIVAAAEKTLEKPALQKYKYSVTEQEIAGGILHSGDHSANTFWFHRLLEGMEGGGPCAMKELFAEEGDDDAGSLLQSLIQKVNSSVPNGNIKKYIVKWTDKGIDPDEVPEHRKYIDSLCEDFEENMRERILAGMTDREDSNISDPLFEEVIQHVAFSQKKCEVFHGREETLELIENYVRDFATSPLVVHGPSGSGKTSVVAMAAKLARDWLSCSDAVVILRFLGTTPNSSNIRKVLYSVVQQINKVYEDDTKIPEDMKLLIRSFRESLLKATAERPLVILPDSLDQLDPDDGARQLSWLPTALPNHVKLILSTLPEAEYEYFPRLQSILQDDSNFVAVPKLAQKDVQEILDQWLSDENRRLSASQMDTVVSACRQCPLPLFLKISFDEACRWHSYSKPEETQLKVTVRDAIVELFERVERNHGQILVSRALGYLTTGKNGLTENELEDILSLDDDVLNDVYQYWTPPIRRLPPLLWVRIRAELSPYLVDRGADGVRVINWYHRQFIETAEDRYFGDFKTKIHLHSMLAEYFAGKWANGVKKPYTNKNGDKGESDRLVAAQPLVFEENSYNLRKLNELPHHLIESGQLQTLKDTALCNLEWLCIKMKGTSLRNVLEDFTAACTRYRKDKQITLLFQLIRLSQDALEHDPAQLAPQLLARISKPQGMETLLEQAKNPPMPCLLPSFAFMTPPGGQLLNTLSGHSETINSIDVTEDGSLIISGDDNNTFKLWDVETGFLIKSIESEDEVKKVAFCNEDKLFAVAYDSVIKIHRTDTIAEVRTLTPRGEKSDSSGGVPFALAGEKKEKMAVPCHLKVLVYDVVTGCQIGKIVDVKLLREYFQDVYVDAKGDIIAYFNENLEKQWNKMAVINLAAGDKKSKIVEVYPDVTYDEDGDEDRTQIGALCVTGDKMVIASNYMDNDLKIYAATSLELVQILKGNTNDLSQYFQLTPDDRYLLFPNSRNVCVWNLQTGDRSYFAEHPNSLERAVSVDGNIIITAASDNLIRIWNISRPDSSKDLTRRDWEFHKGAHEARKPKPTAIKKKKDGNKGTEEDEEDEDDAEEVIDLVNIPGQRRHLILHSKHVSIYSATIWDCVSMKPLVRLSESTHGGKRKFNWTLIDDHLALSRVNRKLKLVDFTTGEILRVFTGKLSYDATYVVNGKTEVVAGTRHNRNLKIYDIKTGNVVHILRHSDKKTKESTQIEDYKAKSDGNGRFVVSKLDEEDLSLYLWDIPLRKLSRVLHLPVRPGTVDEEEKPTLDLFESDLSTDERFLCCSVSYQDDERRPSPGVWDLNTGQYLYTLAHESTGTLNKMVAVGADKLAVSYYDHSMAIWLWSLSTGEPLVKLPGHRRLEVDRLLVSDDERRLLSYTKSSEEREFILWDLENAERLAGFTLDETNEIQLAFGGDVIVVASNSIGSLVTFTLNGPGIEKVQTPTDGEQIYRDMADVILFDQSGANDEEEDPDDMDSDEDSADDDEDDDDGDAAEEIDSTDDDTDVGDLDNDLDEAKITGTLDPKESKQSNNDDDDDDDDDDGIDEGDNDDENNNDRDDEDSSSWNFSSSDTDDDFDLGENINKKKKRKQGKGR